MTVASRLLLVGTVVIGACGGPVASSAGAPTQVTVEPAPSGSPSAADTSELSMQVSGLI